MLPVDWRFVVSLNYLRRILISGYRSCCYDLDGFPVLLAVCERIAERFLEVEGLSGIKQITCS